MKKQTSFTLLNDSNYIARIHGGSLALGKRKSKRPLDRKKPIHLVLKTTNSHTLLWKQKPIKEIIKRISLKFGIKLHSIAVQYDHIHLNLSFQNLRMYVMWIRALTGALVQKISGIKFKFIPFTRLIDNWNRDFRLVQNYIETARKRLFWELKISGFNCL